MSAPTDTTNPCRSGGWARYQGGAPAAEGDRLIFLAIHGPGAAPVSRLDFACPWLTAC